MVTLPTHKKIVSGKIADYWIEDGILFSLSKPMKRTVENISENVALVKEFTQNIKMPLLIYLSNSPVPDKATRVYSKEQLPHIYSAMAMVSEPGLAQLIMKMVFQFQRPPIPMKSFNNDQDAIKWLQQFK
ncbi:STAS/SEC14 domain-containing protein [Aquirufa nivalisilvae]|uniref:STAS/SEC14 domain-containing protein n=1 Tax=Aquirufa TaxID=2676247 RepID=UPI001CAA61A9|nr:MULTISPECIES: STAS/SEC14 domain-containing protein [Aquirufa]MBZ1326877.1 STAS/SEC14 domain-containing protein [Aquirufa aurantiipilula]MCZ2481591.1 STAS/SEC14 domain-containing protein [Aquirufa nivalisilvae]